MNEINDIGIIDDIIEMNLNLSFSFRNFLRSTL